MPRRSGGWPRRPGTTGRSPARGPPLRPGRSRRGAAARRAAPGCARGRSRSEAAARAVSTRPDRNGTVTVRRASGASRSSPMATCRNDWIARSRPRPKAGARRCWARAARPWSTNATAASPQQSHGCAARRRTRAHDAPQPGATGVAELGHREEHPRRERGEVGRQHAHPRLRVVLRGEGQRPRPEGEEPEAQRGSMRPSGGDRRGGRRRRGGGRRRRRPPPPRASRTPGGRCRHRRRTSCRAAGRASASPSPRRWCPRR